MNDTILGIIIMLISTSIMNIGMVIQKQAVDKLPPFQSQSLKENLKAILASPLWILGWVMTTSGVVLNMIALGLADISLIQPLIGFGLIVLVIFSRFYLKESITKVMLAGIGISVIGVIMIGFGAGSGIEFKKVSELTNCYTTLKSIITLCGFTVVIFILWNIAKKAANHIASILYSFISALASVTGLTFSKGFFGMLNLVGFGATLSHAIAYFLITAGLGFSFLAITLQQLSFQKGKAVIVTPIFNVGSVCLPLISGYFVFGENITVMMISAMFFIIFGVYLLSRKAA